MSPSKANACPEIWPRPAIAHLSFATLGDVERRSAGLRKLLANDGAAGEVSIVQDRLDFGVASRADHFRGVDEYSVLIGRRLILVGNRMIACAARRLGEMPNQAPEPTVMSVTSPADAGAAPATPVAHL